MLSENTAADDSQAPTGVLYALEKTAGLQLSNRFVWLVVFIVLLNIAMVSLLQVHYERFDTMQLMALVGLFLEIGLFCSVLIMFLATRVTLDRWNSHKTGRKFSFTLNGLAICLNAFLLTILLLAPVMYIHRYPELAASGLRIPLMMLQREILVLFTVLISANLMQISRYVLKLPWLVSGLIGLATHLAIGYSVTLLSYSNETFLRLNDVFFYNQLSDRFEWFPELLTDHVFHNMEFAHFGYYLLIAAVIWLFTLVLWIPAALKPASNSPA